MKSKRLLVWIGIPTLLCTAGAVGLWFYGRPLIEKLLVQALPEVQASLSQAAGFPIHMDQLTVDRDGIRPILRADRLRLGVLHKPEGDAAGSDCKPGEEWTVEQLEIRFDLWQAITQRKIQLTRVTARGVQGAVQWNAAQRKWTAPALDTTAAASSPPALPVQALATVGALHLERVQLCAIDGKDRRKVAATAVELSTRATAAFTSGNLIGSLRISGVELTGPEYPARDNAPGLTIPTAKLDWSALISEQGVESWEIHDGEVTLNETRWRVDGKAGKTTDLTIELAKPLSFSRLRQILPRGLIPRATDNFLATAVIGAELTSGRVLLRDLKGNDWKVQATGKSVTFQFDEGWPKIEKADVNLELDPNSVRFDVPHAESLGVPATAVHGELRNEHLKLSLQARPDQAALLAWIEKGPFKDLAPQVLKTLTPLSGAELTIQADVPLEEDTKKPTVAKIGIRDLKLSVVSPLQETIEQLRSELAIESLGAETRVAWTETHGRLQGNDWSSSGTATLSSAKNARSEVKGQWTGILQWARLVEVLPSLAPLPASGQIPLTAKVSLERSGSESQWQFDTSVLSQLQGLALEAPSPLQKPASAIWESTFEASGTEAELNRVEITTPPLESRVHWENGVLHTKSRLVAERFSVALWKTWWDQNSSKWKSQAEKKPDSSAASTATPEHILELSTPEFLWSTQNWHKAHLILNWTDAHKKLRVTSQEAVGDIVLEGEGKLAQLKLRFDPLKIQVAEVAPNSSVPSEEAPAEAMNWDEIPELHAFVENLSYGGEHLGTLKIDTKKTDQTLEVTQAELRGAHVTAKIEKGFQKWGLAAKSSWRGSVVFDEYSHRLRGVQSMSGFEIQEGNLQFELDWPGTWDQWGWSKARGQIRGRVRRGALLGVKNSGAQLLNLINLNFADSAMERVRFNALELRFDIDRGSISTPKSKCYVGSTFLRLQGKTNFISDRLELDALVTPNLSGKTLIRALSLISEEDEQADLERELYLTEPENALSKTIRIRGTWAHPKQD